MLSGCSATSPIFDGPTAPDFDPTAKLTPASAGVRPRLGLALSGGGTRGFAHIGVLKVLEREGIRPDVIVGSSVGAVIGALVAAGFSALELEERALKLAATDVIEVGTVFNGGIVPGDALQRFIAERLGEKAGVLMERWSVRFAAVVTRADGSTHVFNRGDASMAARASAAIPGRFLPVFIRGQAYVDGDESSPLPLRAAHAMGAHNVLGINVSAYIEDTPTGAPSSWTSRELKRKQLADAERTPRDLVIHPRTPYLTGFSIDYRKQLIAIAEETTQRMLPQIRAHIATV